jgi:hypothetical protein
MAVLRFSKAVLILFLTWSDYLSAQTYFTVPQNVWRVTVMESYSSGQWIGNEGKSGIRGQPVDFSDYGKRYFDHEYVSSGGYFSSPYDLYDLDTTYVNATWTIGRIIRDFNRNTAPVFGFDTLVDYHVDFFGPDPVPVGGKLDEFRDRTVYTRTYRLEYGTTDRVTFVVDIPYIRMMVENRSWSWRSYSIPGLTDWVAYHQAAQARMDSLFAHPLYSQIDGVTRSNLETIYNRLYSWDSDYSVLWALAAGNDPMRNGIYGPQYNPFSLADTAHTTIDDLLQFYFPKRRQSSGLGDVTLGLQILLAGVPAWKAKGTYSVYGGIRIRLPSGRALGKYHSVPVDPDNPPSQFSELPLGSGITVWNLSLFGEFYRPYRGRLLNFNWFARVGIPSRETLYTPISFLGLNVMHPDSIAALTGLRYFYKPGLVVEGRFLLKLDLLPRWVTAGIFFSAAFKNRDSFLSQSSTWDRWMRQHAGYDTRSFNTRHGLVLIVRNTDPLKKIGPVPFELELGVRTDLLTRNTFRESAIWMGLIIYYQAW